MLLCSDPPVFGAIPELLLHSNSLQSYPGSAPNPPYGNLLESKIPNFLSRTTARSWSPYRGRPRRSLTRHARRPLQPSRPRRRHPRTTSRRPPRSTRRWEGVSFGFWFLGLGGGALAGSPAGQEGAACNNSHEKYGVTFQGQC